jgi:glycosyltransferase involved in cell wall biosynthesis
MGVEDRFTSFLKPRARLLRHYRSLAPFYPALAATHRLPACDLLITSSYAFVHGLRTENDAPQLCYCYSPLRFAWSMTDEYAGGVAGGRIGDVAIRSLAAVMRAADRRAAKRVTTYVAESRWVADQLGRNYGVESRVVWPPVDCERFVPSEEDGHDDYFLFYGRLIEPYKRPTLAVEAFKGSRRRLIVAGEGPAMADLRRRAPANVEFVGRLEDADLIPLIQRSAAVVFPSRDDFGLVPVETMACGRPVLAFAGGGALETVLPGVTGDLFASQDVATLHQAIEDFEPDAYDPQAIRAHAEGWRRERFERELREVAAETLVR